MKKSIAFLLAVLLALTLAACAGKASVEVGGTVQLGGYDWRVLDVQEGKALLLSEKVLSRRAYHPAGGEITWEESDIRDYLNGTFYQETFSSEEKEQILESALENKSNSQYGTGGGNDTTDKVFLLSAKEVEKYIPDSADRIAKDIETGESVLWWLRTPGRGKEYAANVGTTGYVDYHGILVVEAGNNENTGLTGAASGDYASSVDGGVRPALWLKIN